MKQLLLDCKSSLRVAIEHNTFKKYLLSLHHTILYTSSNHTILLVKLSDRKGAYYISIKKDISDIYHYVDEKEYNFSYVYTNTNNHSVIVNISMSIKYMELLKEEIVITPIPILAICWYEYLYDILEETNPNYHIVDNATAIEGISINTICEMFNDKYTFQYDNKAQIKIGDSLYFITQYETTTIFLCIEEKGMYPFLIDNEVKYLNINLYNQHWKGKTDYYPIYQLNTPITILLTEEELESRTNKSDRHVIPNKVLPIDDEEVLEHWLYDHNTKFIKDRMSPITNILQQVYDLSNLDCMYSSDDMQRALEEIQILVKPFINE
jgi:hypothetical protein